MRAKIDKMTDKVGRGIDEGIKEGVVIFNLLGLKTTQSCEGHYGQEEQGFPTPWIQVYPEEPDIENWYENEDLRVKVTKEKHELQANATGLLAEFYKDRNVSYDAMLGFSGIGYGFRIQNQGAEIFDEITKDMTEEEKANKAAEYKKEMDNFASFLKDKYLNS